MLSGHFYAFLPLFTVSKVVGGYIFGTESVIYIIVIALNGKDVYTKAHERNTKGRAIV